MLENKFDFKDLFVFEMANNHQGSVEHGKKIIRECAEIMRKYNIRAAIKFQFRDLGTFIHPEHKSGLGNKHIPRFLSTKLSKDQFKILVDEAKKNGFITMATPFDEASVDTITELGIQIVKIASCSSKDWPLIEKIATLNKPVIASTGGMSIREIDRLVSFLEHRYVHFAIMHCVSIYPTPEDKLDLLTITEMRERYPEIVIGFSTHEDPNNTGVIKVAYTLGSRIFERHVGIETDKIKNNTYSSTPEQLSKWIESYQSCVAMMGTGMKAIDQKEQDDLISLMRGVWLKRDVKKGEILTSDDVFFAIPLGAGQMISGDFHSGVVVDADYSALESLPSSLRLGKDLTKTIIYDTVRDVKAMLSKAGVALNTEFNLEFSHHYGLENFRDVGIIIIDCINREYCKKLIIQLPGQKHPYHHHTKKEEAFQVISGVLELELDGRRRTLHPGDIAVVQRGVKHRFWTDVGTIFEEVSTTHYNDDSLYEDNEINMLDRNDRKTKLQNWGRHTFD